MLGVVDREFHECLVRACGSFGLSLSDEQVARLWRHFELVREANERFNLTRITDPRRAAVEHYADSLTLAAWLAARAVRPRRALDVGTGGGWPAVPLAIVLPDIRWTAIDSTGKKARFVAEASRDLGLANLDVRQARAREMAGKIEPFDLVTCRAVGKIADTIDECRGLLAAEGCLVCYKTAHLGDDERAAGRKAAGRLGWSALPDFPVTLCGDAETYERRLVAFQSPRTRRQNATANVSGKKPRPAR